MEIIVFIGIGILVVCYEAVKAWAKHKDDEAYKIEKMNQEKAEEAEEAERLEAEKQEREHELYLKSDAYKETIYTDEYLLNAMRRMDMNIKHTPEYMPDALSPKMQRVYYECMSPWFISLLAKYRYDKAMSLKLKSDFIEYMECIQDFPSVLFMVGETHDAESAQDHWAGRLDTLSDKQRLIEEAFATLIGDGALKKLGEIKKR